MPNNRMFLLGMGAQKAGTSWHYKYLTSVDEFESGIFKEYRVLDAIYCPETPRRYKGTMKVASQVLSQNGSVSSSQQRFIHRLSVTLHVQYYYDHFANLLIKQNKKIVGDFTPSHSALAKTALQKVSNEFTARNIDVKPIFLMRDPIERAWSALRTARRDKSLRKDEFRRLGISNPYTLDDDELLKILPDTTGYKIRSNYQKTIENAFSKENIIYVFYKELFTDNSINWIVDRIGFEYIKPNLKNIANSSSKTSALLAKTLTYLHDRYDATYRFVRDRFGSERVATIRPYYQKVES